jgi:uncharacterized protein YprB with RNaseH-like and TPR domain
MLTHTFRHIPGIGLKTEKRFWQAGLTSWDDFKEPCPVRLTADKIAVIRACLDESKRHLRDNPLYFYELLNGNQHWRLFSHYRHKTLYLDIETTGLSEFQDHLTTIATYDGTEVRYYVYGENLDDFIDSIARYDLLVTYNGKTFDIPFIERSFGRRINKAHIDLRYILRNLGYTGGLKSCEKQAGLDRGALNGVDGYFAVLLWREYKKSADRKALETLLAYNIEDVVNLETLMVHAFNLSLKETPFFEDLQLSYPPKPSIPFAPDVKVIDRIKRAYSI